MQLFEDGCDTSELTGVCNCTGSTILDALDTKAARNNTIQNKYYKAYSILVYTTAQYEYRSGAYRMTSLL